MPKKKSKEPQVVASLAAAGMFAEATANELMETHGGFWGEHQRFPVSDWQYEVSNDDTRQGYWQWVVNRIEATSNEG